MKLKLLFNCPIIVSFLLLCVSCRNDSDRQGLIDRAEKAIMEEKYEDAVELLGLVLETEPSDSEALVLRSKCFYEQRMYLERTRDLTTLLATASPSCEERMIYLNDIANGYDYYLMDDSAIKYQWLILRLQNFCTVQGFKTYSSYAILSNLYHRKGDTYTALALLDSSENHGNDLYSLASDRAGIYTTMEEIDSALLWQSIAIQEQPKFRGHIFEPGWVYQDRAQLYHVKNEMDSACADWQRALEMGLEEAKAKLDSFCGQR